jgi:pyruvate dehydrogenase E2 component (dihydrolipoamide acetyltransferase)
MSRVFASPLARRIAGQKGVDLTLISGTGPGGRIVKADVEAAKLSPAPKPQRAAAPSPHAVEGGRKPEGGTPVSALPDARLFFKDGTYDAIPHDGMRKSVAKRLTTAKRDIPHYYLTVDIDLTQLLAARERLNAGFAARKETTKLSVNDFVVKAAAHALIAVPEVNASFTETDMLRHKHADIGVAVALGSAGLITPIVFAAETKSLSQISNAVKDLAARARDKKLKPAEYEGGTFAISNLGMYGMKDFTAIINPPHAAILAVGAGETRAVVRDGKVEIAALMTVRLSCDHRVFDGATGARWLQAFKGFCEDPVTMLG